jgi:transcriptional regulator with PAS, ATPase and Fis domain
VTDLKTTSVMGIPAVICSEAMCAVMGFVKRVAQSNASILIAGESGSGKELVARALHECSPRCNQPFVDVNCAALPDHLIESELFGYEKGAFSGADTAKPGMFELAHRGTLFLDEIGELPLSQQGKLLRVLDGWSPYRLGGTRKISVDVRIVAATNADLQDAVRNGRFRADLYHRLNEVGISVPPLRDRFADIAPLARLFLARHNPQLSLSEETLEKLRYYFWPGNIRELKNVMARAAFATTGTVILPEHLPAEVRQARTPETPATYRLERLEKKVICTALAKASGRRDHAAAMLGISRRTLSRRLKEYGPDALGEVTHAELPLSVRSAR